VLDRLFDGPRVIEVGDYAAMFCGKLLGNLGCDVVRIETPATDGLTVEPPLVAWDGRELSAAWLAYNTSKRSISLDVEQPLGSATLDALLDDAAVFIASGRPDWLERHGLLPDVARARRPGQIACAITPFGLDGPYRDYRASDLVVQAAGSFVYLNGDHDRPPVRVSEEQTWPIAGAQAAFAVSAALYGAGDAGESIEVSLHETVLATLVSVVPWWQLEQRIPERHARTRYGRDVRMRQIWPCRDGFVAFRMSFGLGTSSRRNLRLIHWMDEEGMAEDLLSVPWEYTSTLELTQPQVDGWQAAIERFLMTKTKDELYAGALARTILLFPVLELRDILDDRQLAARGFFQPFADGSGHELRFPGPLFQPGHEAVPVPTRPPLPGEHTHEILGALARGAAR
jgi:crotonobetainyl-CoA:carnitine CoA-transferase CaiB-like acyl-CoA transferase